MKNTNIIAALIAVAFMTLFISIMNGCAHCDDDCKREKAERRFEIQTIKDERSKENK